MGEAKRRRAATKSNRTIETHNLVTGETVTARVTCSAYEFIQEHQEFAARDVPGNRASTRVPCNGCRECCWYSHIEVDPLEEDPADLRHLDLVPDASKSGLVLRKKEDGSCVHLGDGGCMVYGHRPRACRTYDCRITAVVGLQETYENGHRSPVWYFPRRTDEEAMVCDLLARAATHEAASRPGQNGRDIAMNTLRKLPELQRAITTLQTLPEEERLRIANAVTLQWNHRAV